MPRQHSSLNRTLIEQPYQCSVDLCQRSVLCPQLLAVRGFVAINRFAASVGTLTDLQTLAVNTFAQRRPCFAIFISVGLLVVSRAITSLPMCQGVTQQQSLEELHKLRLVLEHQLLTGGEPDEQKLAELRESVDWVCHRLSSELGLKQVRR